MVPFRFDSYTKEEAAVPRNKEKKEQEVEKMRDEHFNKYRPMIPQGKVWQIKMAGQPTGPVEPQPPIGQTGEPDRSDCSD